MKIFGCRQTRLSPDLKSMRNAIFVLFLAAALTAQAQEQRFSFGIKGGVPVNDALPYGSAYGSNFSSMLDTGRWTIGPTVELRLVGNLSFEADALLRGYRYQQSSSFLGAFIASGAQEGPISSGTSVALFSSYRQDAKEWDTPLLLKYRFHAGATRPFVDAGAAFAHVSSDFTSTFTCLDTPDACNAAGVGSLLHSSTSSYKSGVNRRGPAAGVGVEFKYRRIKIAPEVRYMHLTRPGMSVVTVIAGFTF